MSDLELLTSSRAKVARACQRLHHLEFDLGYRPVTVDELLRFGQLGHLGLEAWWLAPPGKRLEAALLAVQGEADPYDRVKAEVLLAGYDARWGSEQLEPLAVESEFRAPLINPATNAASRTWQLAGKFDVVVKLPDGRVMILDHKFTSEDVGPGSNYLSRLRLDGQIRPTTQAAEPSATTSRGSSTTSSASQACVRSRRRPSRIGSTSRRALRPGGSTPINATTTRPRRSTAYG